MPTPPRMIRNPDRLVDVEVQISDQVVADISANGDTFLDPQKLEKDIVSWLVLIKAVHDDARLLRSICIRICASSESQALNSRYRAMDNPTNVLSFPSELPDGADFPLGDLAICYELVRAEAAVQHKSFTAHFTHLVIHGVLHLLGLDHQDDKSAARMEVIETEVLKRLNIADPYEA